MASLRARLLAALLALATIGLLLLAGITYVEQRSFLMDRLDEQVREAPPAIGRALRDQGIGATRFGDGYRGTGGGGAGGGGATPGAALGPGAPGGPGTGLPSGTFGQLRDAAGHVIGSVTLGSGSARPDLPRKLPIERIVTIGAKGPDTHRYRVLAQPDRFGGGTIVIAVPLTEIDQTLSRLLIVEGLVIAGVLLLLGAVAWVVVRVGLLPLNRMQHTAGRIAAGDLAHRVTTTDARTEVGRLGIAFNAMLDRLQSAFEAKEASEERLRRFLADASHELRTPLASIRGYAELFRMGAIRDDDDTARAMRRIEDEAARMGILVEDLLTLAHLDAVADAPHRPLDLAPLVRDAADDARAMAPDRAITSEVQGPLRVVGDADQLRQVLGNLVRNALVHTPAGTPIDLRAAGENGHVTLEVRDHGAGLPTARPQELFERFWRATAGRQRGPAGAGLGLAIVAAIVDAHGGHVDAHDAPGGGAAFTVELPAGSQERLT
jgi:two-component system OmpR family sensor kinase